MGFLLLNLWDTINLQHFKYSLAQIKGSSVLTCFIKVNIYSSEIYDYKIVNAANVKCCDCLFKACKVTGKSSTPCIEKKVEGTIVSISSNLLHANICRINMT